MVGHDDAALAVELLGAVVTVIAGDGDHAWSTYLELGGGVAFLDGIDALLPSGWRGGSGRPAQGAREALLRPQGRAAHAAHECGHARVLAAGAAREIRVPGGV